jgi:cyclase
MSIYRIIPCLDVINRRVTKGVKFKDNVDLGDPVELARRYCEDGADELVIYDVTASAEQRQIDIEMVRRTAEVLKDFSAVPFAVGGGIASLVDMEQVFETGAAKVSVNSLAVKNPALIAESVKAFGSQRIVLGMDPFAVDDTKTFPSGYEITMRGFRERSGKDAVDWAKQAADLGVGEIVVNSVDADGTRSGFDLKITGLIAEAVSVPVIASGGAGSAEHVRDAYTIAHADAAIVAGILHVGFVTIPQLKQALRNFGVPVR